MPLPRMPIPYPAGAVRGDEKHCATSSAAVLTAVGLGLASTGANLLLEQQDRASFTPYGERVEIAGGAVNVYRNGQPGQPIVLLSGLGTAAPGA